MRAKFYPNIALGPNPRFVSGRVWGMYFCPEAIRTKMLHVKHFGTIGAYSGPFRMTNPPILSGQGDGMDVWRQTRPPYLEFAHGL